MKKSIIIAAKNGFTATAWTISSLASRIKMDAEKHGFTLETIGGVPAALCLIHSELSEALECYRDNKPIGEELADTLIRTLDLAAKLDIDIGTEIENKMKKNKSRPFKHGRARF